MSTTATPHAQRIRRIREIADVTSRTDTEWRGRLWIAMGILDAGRPPWGPRMGRARTRELIAHADWLERCKRKRRVNPRFRRIVIERARGRCTYCGIKVRDENFCIDHIRPVRWGGRSVLKNLAAACWSCNTEKSDQGGWKPYGAVWRAFVALDAHRASMA